MLDCGDRIFVEAAPRDCIWGIGLSKDDPRANSEKKVTTLYVHFLERSIGGSYVGKYGNSGL